MILYTQDELLTLIFKDPDNKVQLGVDNNTWQSWRKRFRGGTLTEQTQQKIIKEMGYYISIERKWTQKLKS